MLKDSICISRDKDEYLMKCKEKLFLAVLCDVRLQ